MFKTGLLYQNDNKWKNVMLGNSPETIGSWGGLLTSITMMLNGLGYTETPVTVNEKLKKANGFLKSLAGLSQVALLWPNCVYCGMTICGKSGVPISRIDESLAAGKPVILEVDSSEQTGSQTHFVLVKEKKGDDYVLYDPHRYDGDRPDREVLLTKRYKYNGATLKSEIGAVLWFDRLSPALPVRPGAARLPVPADKFILFVTEENVLLRDKPSVDSFPWKRMDRWTDLISLEAKAIARARVGMENQWIRVQDPDGAQGYVSAAFVTADLPDHALPPDVPSLQKKWCLKNISLQNPRLETRGSDNELIPDYQPTRSFNTLRKNTVVEVLKSNELIPGWVAVSYQERYYEKKRKEWLTTRVAGWVKETELDDYYELEKEGLRTAVVTIDNQTESLTDAQQYFYIEDKNGKRVRYNMCGELCVAAIVGKGIQSVLHEWQEKSQSMYDSMVGLADKPLGPRHIENLLGVQGVTYERYKVDEKGNPRKDYIHLADPEGDRRLASKDLDDKLKTHFFITNLRIDTNTGGLEPAYSAEDRNHWVVLSRVTRKQTRVELYNPYPNRIEEYSFGEFYRAVGGDPNSGWWIAKDAYPALAGHKANADEAGLAARQGLMGGTKAAANRKKDRGALQTEEAFQPPTLKVAIDNQTAETRDAEQYLYIRGEGSRPKTKLCGEFCVTFILGQSLNGALTHWLEKQKQLQKQGEQPEIWELATLLQAYGFNRRKYIRPQKNLDRGKYYVSPNIPLSLAEGQHFKSFSIDTVLEYWKGVQPDLYSSLLGGDRNEPTGPEDLITILKAYGYKKGDYSYYRPGSKEVFGYAPGRDAEIVGKTHYLLAGVNIHGTTGRLQPSGVAHWVVVTKIIPRGNLVGGNGGWVELYNPFPNCWEEYSYREFMDAFRGMSEGSTLWIKKDVSPEFAWQPPAPPKSSEKALKSSGKGKGNKDNKSNQKKDKKGGGDKEKNKGKKGGKLQTSGDEPPLDANQLVCERLGVAAIPWEIGRWIRDTSNGDRFFAEELIDALLECGILSIQEQESKGKKTLIAILADPDFSERLEAAVQKSVDSLASPPQDPAVRVTQAVMPLFLSRVREEIKAIQKGMPAYAHRPRAEFRAWTRGLASKFSDSLDVDLKERLDRLPGSLQDRAEIFRVCKIILTRFTSGTIEEAIRKIQNDSVLMEQIRQTWDLNQGEQVSPEVVREWILGLASGPRKNVYRVRRWGNQGMNDLGFAVSKLQAKGENSNFQAVGLYNKATGFGAISNYLIIPPEDVLRLEALQVEDEYEQKRQDWLRQKMNWLCQHRGSMYMFGEDDNYRGDWSWRRPEGIRWGTLAIGGNLVQVVDTDTFEVKLPGKDSVEPVEMARLKGFKPDDWERPLDELLAEGLVHRCFCVYKGNDIGDSPQGIVYSPFWSPEDWEFRPKTPGVPAPKELWIPVDYLEEWPRETAGENLQEAGESSPGA